MTHPYLNNVKSITIHHKILLSLPCKSCSLLALSVFLASISSLVVPISVSWSAILALSSVMVFSFAAVTSFKAAKSITNPSKVPCRTAISALTASVSSLMLDISLKLFFRINFYSKIYTLTQVQCQFRLV